MITATKKHLVIAWNAAIEATSIIMQVYRGNYQIAYKNDQSPVTIADKLADKSIRKLLQTTDIPIISEESETVSYHQRKNWDILWMVDPLDGTKEFIKNSTNFTVNIALIEHKIPTLGIIIAPALNIGYWASKELGAFKTSIMQSVDSIDNLINHSQPIRCSNKMSEVLRIIGTKSHMNRKTEDFYKRIKTYYSQTEFISVGSSLKFCKIAEGEADLYIRYSNIYEWDTAAGDAIVRNAGGSTLELNDWKPILYNQQSLMVNYFVSGHPYFIHQVEKLFE